MMMMMMISYVSQEHSRAGSNCFWKLRVKVIHYSFTRKQNSISFFFRRNGETVVIAKTSGLTGMNPAFWKNWLPSYGEKCQNSEMFDVDIEWKKPIKVPAAVNK